jgi:hypothetical protein
MKHILRNSVTALVALFVLTFSVNAIANDEINPSSVVNLKFIGNHQSNPVFELNMLNEAGDEFTITISDLEGNVLYSDRVKGTNISRKFAINTDEIGDNTLRIDVRSRNSNKKETYNISRTQTYVMEASVTRVN